MSHLSDRARIGRRVAALLAALVMAVSAVGAPALAAETATQRYIVVFGGTYALDGSYALGGNYALNHEYALQAVAAAGGSVTSDLSKQIGVMVVESANAQFAALMGSYALVEVVGSDVSFQAVPSRAARSKVFQWAAAGRRGWRAPGADVRVNARSGMPARRGWLDR